MSDRNILGFLDDLYIRFKMKLGGVIQSRWLYGGSGCPGCGSKISTMKFRTKV